MPDIIIKSAWKLGTPLWVKTDPEQQMGILIGVTKKSNGGIFYEIAIGFEVYICQFYELSEQKNFFLNADIKPPKDDDEDDDEDDKK